MRFFKNLPLDRFLHVYMLLLTFAIAVSPLLKSILLVLILLTVLMSPLYRKQFLYVLKSPWCWAALGLLILTLVSTLWTPATVHEQLNSIDKYSKLLVLPLLTVGFMSANTREKSRMAFLIAMGFTGFLALGQAYGFINLHGSGLTDPGYVFHSHIMNGFLMAFASYHCLLMMFKQKTTASRWLYSILALFFAYQVFFVNIGRTGYVIFLLLMIILCLQKFSIKKALLGTLMVIGLFGLIYTQNVNVKQQVNQVVMDYQNYKQDVKSTSLGFRIQFHQYAKSLYLTNPVLGHGLASFRHLSAKDLPVVGWGPYILEPHSEYWLNAVEKGTIGLVLLLAFFGSLIWNATKIQEGKPYMLALVITFSLGCFSDSLLFYGGSGYFLIVFAAMGYGEYFEKDKKMPHMVHKQSAAVIQTAI